MGSSPSSEKERNKTMAGLHSRGCVIFVFGAHVTSAMFGVCCFAGVLRKRNMVVCVCG